MDIVSYFIRNKLVGWIIIAVSLIWGAYAYFQMPRFEDPEFLIRTAQIITEYPGASPLEVADEINDPIETEIAGMQEVEELRSKAFFGYSVIEVDIKRQFAPTRERLQLAWSRLRAKVDDATRRLPPGAQPPFVLDDYGDVFGLYYLVTGDGFSNKELDDYVEAIRRLLISIPGVAKVEKLGKQQEVIYIEISQARAAALGASIDDVFSALNRQNAVLSAGSQKIGDQRLIIYPSGNLETVQSIENVMVSIHSDDGLVRIGDLAKVKRGLKEPSSPMTFYNGEPAIGLGIANVAGANVAEIGEAVRAKLQETQTTRPFGIEIHEFYHQGDVVNEAVLSFAVNMLLALLIVLVTLMVFMGMRSALVIGSVLAITIASTLTAMQIFAIPMHRISLGALIIALGMLVDNAIVVTEGILTGTRKGRSVLSAAKDIVGRTRWALLGGTVVGIVAFAPIGFAPGDTAEYSNHLFWVIFISLAFSWIYAITLTPMLADLLFKGLGEQTPGSRPSGLLMQFKRTLGALLHFRWLVVMTSTALLAVSVWGFQFIEEGFFPTAMTPQIAIDYWLPESTDIQATARDAALIQKELADIEAITGIHTIVGAGALRYMLIYTPEVENHAYAQLILKVDEIENIPGLIPRIQTYLDETFPASQARVWRFRLGPSQGPRIEASFSGPDPDILRMLAAEAKEIFAREAQAVGAKTDWRNQIPVIVPEYDANRGGRQGVSREDFVSALNRHFSGETVGVFREGDELIPILVRSPQADREVINTLDNIQVPSRLTGGTSPLSEQLVAVNVDWRDAQMIRQDRIWTIKVQADPIDGVQASSVMARLRPVVEAIELPPGYTLTWDGEYGDSTKANAELAGTLPLGVLAMILVVILLFNALRQAAIIWLTVPLAIIGVVWGLYLTDTPMEFMALLGLLSLSGLMIKNAIVLVDQMDAEIRDGKPRFDAILDSAASRVRPVAMGAATTVLGVLPLIHDVFFASMAAVIVFGLSFATVLTLVYVPVLYSLFFGIEPAESCAA